MNDLNEMMKNIVEKTKEITGKELLNNIITDSDISANTITESIERFNSVMDLAGYLSMYARNDLHIKQIKDTVYDTILLILTHHKSKMDYQLTSCIYTALCEINAVFINKIRYTDDVAEILNYVLWITYAAYCLSKGIQNEAKEICFEVHYYDADEVRIKAGDIDIIASIQDIICRLDEYYMDINYYVIHDGSYLINYTSQ